MTRQLGKFIFGFGAVAIVDPTTEDLRSFIDTPGEVTINTKPELITAAGGPGNLSIIGASRPDRRQTSR